MRLNEFEHKLGPIAFFTLTCEMDTTIYGGPGERSKTDLLFSKNFHTLEKAMAYAEKHLPSITNKRIRTKGPLKWKATNAKFQENGSYTCRIGDAYDSIVYSIEPSSIESDLDEAISEGMPASIIKTKQSFANKSAEELYATFKEIAGRTGKSVEQLAQSAARRHGLDINAYWNRIKSLTEAGKPQFDLLAKDPKNPTEKEKQAAAKRRRKDQRADDTKKVWSGASAVGKDKMWSEDVKSSLTVGHEQHLIAIKKHLAALTAIDGDDNVSHDIAHELYSIATDMKLAASELRGRAASKWEQRFVKEAGKAKKPAKKSVLDYTSKKVKDGAKSWAEREDEREASASREDRMAKQPGQSWGDYYKSL